MIFQNQFYYSHIKAIIILLNQKVNCMCCVTMSSPWAKIYVPEPLNLKEIIYEEIAKESNNKCNKISKVRPKFQNEVYEELLENHDDTNTDAEIIRDLEQAHEKENQNTFKTDFNYTSLFLCSKNNIHQFDELDSESYTDEEEAENVNEHEDNAQHSDEVISKYDIILKSKSSVSNKCCPELDDNVELYFQLPNKVCNDRLKLLSKCDHMEEKLYDRKEDNTISEFAIDFSTRLQLQKLINKQILEKVNNLISESKAAVVFHANSNPSYSDTLLPKEYAVKTYKTTLADLKPWETYMCDNKYFIGRIERHSIRRTIHLWAQRELQNLFKLQKAGIPCPQPIALKQHVLVMSFIGENHDPAPQLKHAKMEADEYEEAYSQVIKAMKTLYKKAKLIHGNLSENNILWHNKQCYFIDVSLCVESNYPGAFYLLMRDCESVTKFFSNQGVLNIKSPRELFQEITGLWLNHDRLQIRFENFDGIQNNQSRIIPSWVFSTFHEMQFSR